MLFGGITLESSTILPETIRFPPTEVRDFFMPLATVVALGQDESVDTSKIVRQLAHELRQPLSTIESIAYYLDLILPRHDGRARAQLERLQRLVEQSNWIVTNAVHFVQASPAMPQLLDLGELIPSAAAECPPGAAIEIDRHTPLPLIRLDPAQAIHLFRNLLGFFRYIGTPEQTVMVRSYVEPDCVAVRLSAPVRGYATDEIEAMFEPFAAGGSGGSGLSLASAQRIVDAHEGSLTIDAEPDEGVAITVRLPA